MPLGTREVLVAIRARDVTSRVLREIGTNFGHLTGQARAASMSMFNTGAALTAVGVGMAGVGAIGLKFFNDSVDSFIEYSRQAAYTKTQVDDLNVSVADIADVGKMVASKIPVPFEEMQDALYDIFSSTNANIIEATGLLELFSKGAVAGQTDVRTAARATIAVMNAYHIPFSQANDVMDTMFEMVRVGVGTYEEFNVAIGRAIPAAVSASQSFETLAGIMAFLTRQGLSTQMAATSAARAFELFTKPDVVESLRDIGVEVTDAEGNFRQLNDIILDLANSEGWAKMGAADRKKMFQDIFGTGTIQARRFFDTAIPNFRDLNTLTDITVNSSGALGAAYETMFAQPAMQAQLLKNKYEILRVEIGEKLLPAKIRLIEVATKIIDWWNSLSESTRTLTIKIAAGTAAFLAIGGAVVTALGAFIMISAILGPFGITMTSLATAIGVVVAGFAVGVAVFKAFGGGIQGLIAGISAAVLTIVALGAAFGAISAAVTGVGFALSPLTIIIAAIAAAVLAAVIIWKNWDTIKGIIAGVVDKIKMAWEWFTNLSLAGKLLIGVIVALVAPFILVIAAIVALIKNFDSVVDAAKGVWEWFNNLHMVGKVLISILAALAAPITVAIGLGVAIAKNWSTVVQWGRNLVDAAKNVWEWFTNLGGVFKIIAAIMSGIAAPFIAAGALIVGVGRAIVNNWDSIKNATVSVWSVIVDAIDFAWNLIKGFWNWLTNIDLDIWGDIKNATISTWNTIKNTVSTVIDAVGSAISSAADAIMVPISALWGLLKDGFEWFSDNFGDQFADIWDTAFSEAKKIIEEFGETFSVIWQDIKNFWDNLKSAGGEVVAIFSPITAVIGALASVFGDAFADAFNTFMDAVSEVIKFFTPSMKILKDGVVAIARLVVTILGSMANVFRDKFMLVFNITKVVFNIIVSVIKAAVDIIVSIWDRFGGIFLSIAKDLWAAVSGIIVMGIKIISNIIQFFLNLIQGDWGEAWQNIKNILAAIWDGIVAVIGSTIDTLLTLVGDLPNAIVGLLSDLWDIMFELGKDIINGLIEGAKAVLQFLFDLGKDIFDGIVNTIKDLFGIGSPSTVMIEVGKDIIQGLFDGIKFIWELISTWLGERLDAVLEFFSDALNWLLEPGKDIFRGLISGIKFIWDNSIAGWFGERKEKFLKFFDNAVDWLVEVGKNVLRGLWTGIKFIWDNSIFGWFSERKQKFLDFFSTAISWLTEVGKNVLRGLWSGIKAIWDITIVGWFTGSDGGGGISGKFKGFFTNAVNWLKNAGRDIINGLKSGIKSVVDNMGDWISDRVDDIVDAFKSFFGISSPSTVMMEVGKNFILGFMEGVVTAAKNIPALIGKIGMGMVDLMKYLGINIFEGVTTGNIGSNFIRNIMQQMAAEVGWTGAQWEALAKLVQSESGFNPNAQNPTSSAYGLFQFLDSTWASVGFSKTSNPIQQILAGFAYIKSRYGNPLAAWNFWQSNSPHWYAKGAWELPYTGLIGAHKGEMIIPRSFASQLRDVMTGSKGNGASFNFYGDVTFGSDMDRATNDLDFWARTQGSGV